MGRGLEKAGGQEVRPGSSHCLAASPRGSSPALITGSLVFPRGRRWGWLNKFKN